MKSEIEVKFINVDLEDIRARLKDVGASLEHPMRLMKRVVIEQPHHQKENSFVRIRDEGDKTTLTFKRRSVPDEETTIDSTYELETTVGDFDTTVQIFTEAGWDYETYQENKRETWQYEDTEIVIDLWPWLRPTIEIEADSEEKVRSMAKKLGFNWEDAVFGSIDVIYHREYPKMSSNGIFAIKEVRFDDPLPKEFEN